MIFLRTIGAVLLFFASIGTSSEVQASQLTAEQVRVDCKTKYAWPWYGHGYRLPTFKEVYPKYAVAPLPNQKTVAIFSGLLPIPPLPNCPIYMDFPNTSVSEVQNAKFTWGGDTFNGKALEAVWADDIRAFEKRCARLFPDKAMKKMKASETPVWTGEVFFHSGEVPSCAYLARTFVLSVKIKVGTYHFHLTSYGDQWKFVNLR